MKRPGSAIALYFLILVVICPECLSQSVSASKSPALPPLYLICYSPSRASLNQEFTLRVGLVVNDPSKLPAEPIHVEAAGNEAIAYKPAAFDLNLTRPQLVKVKITKSDSGIAQIELDVTNGDIQGCRIPVDVGFPGRLKLAAEPILTYKEPTALTVAIVDRDNKPLALDVPFSSWVQFQAAEAQLSDGTPDRDSKEPRWSETLTLPVPAQARSTPQFLVRATNKRGGMVHIAASFSISQPPYGAVLAQENFSLSADPAWWLPIILAIGGSMLYGIYSFVQAPKAGWGFITLHFSASIVSGIIAYLFAGFDLLGLKLDPNVLKTYPLLGFLFSYAGIEILLSKRFKSAEKAVADGNEGNQNQKKEEETKGAAASRA